MSKNMGLAFWTFSIGISEAIVKNSLKEKVNCGFLKMQVFIYSTRFQYIYLH